MRAIDRWAIEERGIPSLDLMERAGAGLTVHTDRLVPRGPIAIVCGKGNNGGDGFVAGRLLRGFGRTVRVLLLAEPDEYSGDAAENLRRLEGAHEPFDPRALDGRGGRRSTRSSAPASTGEPRGSARRTRSRRSRRFEGPVVAADIASGVDASTGEARARRRSPRPRR